MRLHRNLAFIGILTAAFMLIGSFLPLPDLPDSVDGSSFILYFLLAVISYYAILNIVLGPIILEAGSDQDGIQCKLTSKKNWAFTKGISTYYQIVEEVRRKTRGGNSHIQGNTHNYTYHQSPRQRLSVRRGPSHEITFPFPEIPMPPTTHMHFIALKWQVVVEMQILPGISFTYYGEFVVERC